MRAGESLWYQMTRLARNSGLPVYVWSVYDTDRMLQYLQMGVTGLITDFPDLGREVVDAYRESTRHRYQSVTVKPPGV